MIIFTPNTLIKSSEVNANFVSVKTELYPIGSIYTNASNGINPGTLLGFGTWVAFGAGKVQVGIDTGQTEFDTAEETGGAKTHTLSAAEMPTHNHDINSGIGYGAGGLGAGVGRADANSPAALWSFTSGNAGSGNAHNNLQPYIVVYMWKRTA